MRVVAVLGLFVLLAGVVAANTEDPKLVGVSPEICHVEREVLSQIEDACADGHHLTHMEGLLELLRNKHGVEYLKEPPSRAAGEPMTNADASHFAGQWRESEKALEDCIKKETGLSRELHLGKSRLLMSMEDGEFYCKIQRSQKFQYY